MKRGLSILLTLALALTMCSGTAFAKDKNAKASYKKTETVYGKLDHDGSAKSLEIVNRFEVEEGGRITDRGDYSKLTNLTDDSLLQQEGDQISFVTKKDDFYYQGVTQDSQLPWNYQIQYTLDGTTVDPEDLAGAEGHLRIAIHVRKNPDCSDKSFYKHYVTQISVSLPIDKTRKVRAEGASIAEAGQDQQVSFTLLPEEEDDFVLTAYVSDFEMDGISIAAVPYSSSIDTSDLGTDDLVDSFDPLIKATNKLRRGARRLSNGIYKLGDNGDSFTDGLDLLEDGLSELGDAFTTCYQALDEAISSSPEGEELPTETELSALDEVVQSSGNEDAISAYNKLLACYQSLLTIQSVYQQVQPAFEAVSTSLDADTGSLILAVQQLSTGMAKYVKGVYKAADGADTYADGMKSYAKGISSIPDEMEDEIDDMMDKYNSSDFQPTSFADSRNGKVQSVQFVFSTEEIKLPDKEDNGLKNITEQEKDDGGILGRLKSLFGL